MSSYPLAEMTRARNRISELETKLRDETIERETFQHGMRQQERRIEQLEREKAELVKAVSEISSIALRHVNSCREFSSPEMTGIRAICRNALGATVTEGGEG